MTADTIKFEPVVIGLWLQKCNEIFALGMCKQEFLNVIRWILNYSRERNDNFLDNFRFNNFGTFIIFDLHRQYVYQMKAEIILNSNLV